MIYSESIFNDAGGMVLYPIDLRCEVLLFSFLLSSSYVILPNRICGIYGQNSISKGNSGLDNI
jgi:hypothetical protein